MKNILYRISSIAILVLATIVVGCDEELTVFEGPYHARFSGTSASVNESATTETTIQVHFAGPKPTEAITIEFSVTGGAAGTDFNLIGSNSLTIPAGEYFASFKVSPINDDVASGNKVITFEITSVSNGISAGLGLVGKKYNYTIVDDDCPFKVSNFTGTLVAVEPGYSGSPYDVSSAEDPTNPNAIIIDNFWDYGGEVKYIFDPASNKVDLPTQDVVMGGDTYVVSSGGQGLYEACNNKFVVPYKVTLKANGSVQDENTHTFTKK
jgi:hypothetical protein